MHTRRTNRLTDWYRELRVVVLQAMWRKKTPFQARPTAVT